MQDMENGGLFDAVVASTEQKEAEDPLLQTYRRENTGCFWKGRCLRERISSFRAPQAQARLHCRRLWSSTFQRMKGSSASRIRLSWLSLSRTMSGYSIRRAAGVAAGREGAPESCLRMRPDRVLLQELRDGTAFYYIRNINSGHPGSITTVHADSPISHSSSSRFSLRNPKAEGTSTGTTSAICSRSRST